MRIESRMGRNRHVDMSGTEDGNGAREGIGGMPVPTERRGGIPPRERGKIVSNAAAGHPGGHEAEERSNRNISRRKIFLAGRDFPEHTYYLPSITRKCSVLSLLKHTTDMPERGSLMDTTAPDERRNAPSRREPTEIIRRNLLVACL